MSTRMRELYTDALGRLRHEPTAKRIRAMIGDTTVVDSRRAVLLWEPRRVVPSWAVPVEDVQGEMGAGVAASTVGGDVGLQLPDVSDRPILDPSVPFVQHSTDGETVDLRVAGQDRAAAGFLLADPDLEDYVVLDFDAFDAWYEEDELNVAHPREPFHRIDVVPSSRHVRLELDGVLLAETTRPRLLFESMLPTRYYVPREDVRAELAPSPTRTWCAYKGQASYWSPTVGDRVVPDLAWSYEDPLHDASPVGGLVAFFDERVDVVLDGERRERPVTPWS